MLDGISITDYDEDATYSSADKVAEYITYTPVAGQPEVYKVVVQTQDSFGINAKVSLSDGNNTWETERYLDVEYVQKNDGLVAKDWIDWDDDGKPYINEDATFTKELWTSPGNDRLAYFAYLTSEEDENPTTVKAADITVTCGGVTAGEDKVVVKVCDKNEDLISFSFKAVGDYVITYTGTGDKNKSVTMHVQYPEVGFYTAATISENNLLDGRFEYDDTEAESAKTFYMILHTDDEDATVSLKDTPFQINDYDKNETYTDADKVAEYISYAPVAEQSGVYKIIVQTESEFNLTAFAQVSAGEDNSWDTENSVEVAWVPKIEGFVAKWPMWSEDNGFQDDPNEPWQKKIYTDLNTATLLLAYMEDEDDDNPREIEGLSDLSAYYGETAINLTEQNDYVSCERVRQEPEGAGGVYSFTFKKTGEYKLVYSYGTVSKTLKLVVEYPSIGLYRTDEITDAGFVSFENGYTWSGNDNTAYLIFNDHVTSVSDVTATVTDCFSDVVTLTEVEEKLYKLTFSKEASDFNVKLSAEVTYDWGSESFDTGLNVVYSGFVSGGVYTDGEAHLGYSGCYITKEEFDRNTVFYNASKPLFWVHADTVQGVIDKLSKVASGEEVLYKEVVEATTGTTIPDTSSTTEGMEITNTGYILIAVSQHGNTDMQEQYVSSSGNMKGIIFEAGQDHFYTVHDKENGVYIEDTVYNLDLYRSHLNDRGFYDGEIKTMLPSDLEDESYVSYYKGDFYHVSNTSNGTQEYFTLGEKITYDSDKEDTQREWLDKMRSGGTTSDEGVFKHYMEPGKFPDMHVNVYCDMKFAGRYEKLYIGFKEGHDYTATLIKENEGQYEEDKFTRSSLEGAQTKALTKTISYWDNQSYKTENIDFWLYDINSEATTSGNYEGTVEVAEAPEPNAMPELTQDQKNAIEDSKKLTVDVQVNPKQEVQIDQEALDKIEGALKNEKVDGRFYVDISVSASVEGVAGSTDITELKADMDITIELPADMQKPNRKYGVVCYHEKDGKREAKYINADLSTKRDRITFAACKFSTYAIVYEEGHVHTISDWIIAKEATETETGLRVKKCTGCGMVMEQAEIAKLPHTHKAGSWVVTKEATAKATGLKEQKCSVCGATMASKIIPKFVVKLNEKSIPLQVKKSTTAIKATVMDGDAVKSWSTSNKKVAVVDNKGKITAKKAGTAVITVTTKKGATAKVTVNVQKKTVKCTKLKADKTKLTLKVKKSYQLNVVKTPITTTDKVSYKSSNKKVATVNGKGKITAKKAGTATITVKCGKKTVKVKVKVKK